MRLSTRLAAAMVALALATASISGIVAYRAIEAELVPSALERFETRARLLTRELNEHAAGARADILATLADQALIAMTRVAATGDLVATTRLRSELAQRFLTELSAKQAYFRWRVLDDAGKELVRVDRSGPGESVRVPPDTELKDAGAHAYVQAAVRLASQEFYVSQLELLDTTGATDPALPVVHVAAPVFDPHGRQFGLVVLTVDMRPALERLRNSASQGSAVYLVNHRGDFLVHPDRSREFAFEFGRSARLHDDIPQLASALGAARAPSAMVATVPGRELVVAMAPMQFADGPWLAVVEAAPYETIMEPAAAVRWLLLLAGLVAVLGAVALAVPLARSLARPLERMTAAVEDFGRGGRMALPVAAGGEIGVLARAIVGMADQVQQKTAALGREVDERRGIVDCSLDLIAVVDLAGRFRQVSPICMSMLGYEPSELVGRSVADIIHPEDIERSRRQLRLARRIGSVRNFETRCLRKEGQLVTLSWSGTWSASERRYVFVGRDVTEQRRAAEALRQAHARLNAVFNCSVYGILTLNESGTVESLNPEAARIFGLDARTAMRRDIGRMIELGGPPKLGSGEQLRQMLSGEHGVSERTGRSLDGTTFPVEIMLAEMPIDARRMFVVFVRDITRRKQAERLKSEFVATVSHELRTPMTSIAGSLGLLCGGAAGPLPDPAKRLLTIAHNNSQRLVRLINDILDIERIESGKVAFALQPVEIRALAAAAIESIRSFSESYGVAVTLDTDAAETAIWADPDRMSQVVTNLLSNAVKFSPHGGLVEIGIAQHGARVRLEVRDRGPGIPKDYRTRIFEKFVQVDASDAREKSGTGLGLSIVHELVRRFGGEVGVDARPGGGSVFYFELPCWERTERLEAEWLGSTGLLPVLLCEDDPDAAMALAERLRAAGFAADVAHTAEEAIKGAAKRSYSAILVDLQLPDSDGISVIRHLRAQPQHQNTPIVVVSADPSRGRRDWRSSALNVLDWLEKPIDTERLMRVLQRPMVRDAHVRPRIIHLDDDREVLRLVAQALGSIADVVSVESIDEARHMLDCHHFDLAVLDVELAEGFGFDLLPDLCGADGEPIPIVVFSVQDTQKTTARVLAVLSKSRAPIEALVTTLRRLVIGRIDRAPAERDREVA